MQLKFCLNSTFNHVPQVTENIETIKLPNVIPYFVFSKFEILGFVSSVLKRMQKQGNKHTLIMPMLNKIFDKHFSVFKVFVDTTENLIKILSLPCAGTTHLHFCFIIFLFVRFHASQDATILLFVSK